MKPSPTTPSRQPAGWPVEALLDAFERQVLVLDTLRRRGNHDIEHAAAGDPPLLKFEHRLVLDGRDLPRPCNYALLEVRPGAGDPPPDPRARPVVVVDPRAGHGPGIGGFKRDSEVGVALRAGHPLYFVTFRPQPEEGQTLDDVMAAEARFLEEVIARHPACRSRPVVIGNCQAGWAISMLAAQRPELFGPLMVVGAPLSYWAGGSRLNPMRYGGAALGGAWLAALACDLGGDRFDGAHLVQNFENLNPAHAAWGKYHRLWAGVDTEADRFLEFERWWGGFFRMTGAEFEKIVENLFVGNRLARGQVQAHGRPVDLRHITSPVVVFASWGDNITPPPQALNWIIDTWGSERAIAAAGRVVVYVLHESVGHLGIFVGADIARKEHDQIVNSLDVIEHLPPGLYEMKVQHKDGHLVQRWDALEPGSWTVRFEHRTMDDLRAINPEGRDEERIFSTVAQWFELLTAAYKSYGRPWLRTLPMRAAGELMLPWHPLRLQRSLFSDRHPAAPVVAWWADRVRSDRHALAADHPGRAWEQPLSTAIESSLDGFRRLRDHAVMQWTRLAFGPAGLGALLPPDPTDEAAAVARAEAELDDRRRDVLPRIAEGGLPQAVCRIVVAGMKSIGSFERRSLRLARLMASLDADAREIDWRALLREEARIAAVAPVEALLALDAMLPGPTERERALAIAASVLLIEPTLDHPDSEIVEMLIGELGVDPVRVMALAGRLTASLHAAEAAASIDERARPNESAATATEPTATARRRSRAPGPAADSRPAPSPRAGDAPRSRSARRPRPAPAPSPQPDRSPGRTRPRGRPPGRAGKPATNLP